MTTTDYLINAFFIFVVLRQAKERRVDLRSFLLPMGVVAFVAQMYVHSIPTAGNDLLLVAAVATVGLVSGIASGFATHIRIGEDGAAMARVGWIAGALLVAGISARMIFVFAINNGLEPTIRSFSIANHIDAAAWPLAFVAMALLEVTARLVTVQVRAHRMVGTQAAPAIPIVAEA